MPEKTTPARRLTQAEKLATLPAWGADPLARLDHTLAAHPHTLPGEMALYATLSHHPEPGIPAQTGITWGDLAQLAEEVRAARRRTRPGEGGPR